MWGAQATHSILPWNRPGMLPGHRNMLNCNLTAMHSIDSQAWGFWRSIIHHMFFYLNQFTKIRVKTSCGYTGWGEVGDGLGQGSGAAGMVSALNLDRKIDMFFGKRMEMVKYGGVKQKPYSWQDDTMCMVENVENLRIVFNGMEDVMKMMQVESNKTKCGYLVIGPNQAKPS